MEEDGKTRVYYYHELGFGSKEYKVKEAWPEHTGWTDESWIFGKKANETFERAEFICVNVYQTKVTGFWLWKKTKEFCYWSVHPKGYESSSEWFDIDRRGLKHDQEYPDLARKLEKHTGKKGLTIFVS